MNNHAPTSLGIRSPRNRDRKAPETPLEHEQREALKRLSDAAARELKECSLASGSALRDALAAAAPFLEK